LTALIFAGPTLFGSRIALPAGVELRPPARCGDIARAIATRPTAIGLIDGVFGDAPSVWHKELLAAIDAGIAVYGAGSLGAVRAAELDREGMTGIGGVYRSYRSGRQNRDDAVLVVHAPAELGWRPLTVALVDIEVTLAMADIAADDRSGLLRLARRMPFEQRTWKNLLDAHQPGVGRCGSPLVETLSSHGSAKRRDAEQLLVAVAAVGSARPHRQGQSRNTTYYDTMLASLESAASEVHGSSDHDAGLERAASTCLKGDASAARLD